MKRDIAENPDPQDSLTPMQRQALITQSRGSFDALVTFRGNSGDVADPTRDAQVVELMSGAISENPVKGDARYDLLMQAMLSGAVRSTEYIHAQTDPLFRQLDASREHTAKDGDARSAVDLVTSRLKQLHDGRLAAAAEGVTDEPDVVHEALSIINGYATQLIEGQVPKSAEPVVLAAVMYAGQVAPTDSAATGIISANFFEMAEPALR